MPDLNILLYLNRENRNLYACKLIKRPRTEEFSSTQGLIFYLNILFS